MNVRHFLRENHPAFNSVSDKTISYLEGETNYGRIRNFILERAPQLKDRPDVLTEAIILLAERPVSQIHNGTFDESKLGIWSELLLQNRTAVELAIRSVGRIEFTDNPGLDWGGTGWIISNNIVVTNRHVAAEVARNIDGKAVFRDNFRGKKMGACIDFLEEQENPQEEEYALEVLYLSDESDFDYAFLKIQAPNNKNPIELINLDEIGESDVCAIGYPAWDGRRNDPIEMSRIFGLLFDVKRLAPGKARIEGKLIRHDCSTLGGNSGSVVLDIKTGKAAGLHFSGRYGDGNYAVPARVLAEKIQELKG